MLGLPGGGRVAFTTDTYVVRPLFFPGGDIGELAVFGTVNDLAMSGATPLALSTAFVREEGLELEVLTAVATSMGKAAMRAGVGLVTGDTKVVERGHGDGLYVNTAGIGVVPDGVDIRPGRATPGDVVLVTSLAPEIDGEQTPKAFPVPADLVPAMAHQLDLDTVVAGTGITVYANTAWIPVRAEVAGATAPGGASATAAPHALSGRAPRSTESVAFSPRTEAGIHGLPQASEGPEPSVR